MSSKNIEYLMIIVYMTFVKLRNIFINSILISVIFGLKIIGSNKLSYTIYHFVKHLIHNELQIDIVQCLACLIVAFHIKIC